MKRRIEPALHGRVEVSIYLDVRSGAGFEPIAEAIRGHLSRAAVGAYVVLSAPVSKGELTAVMTGDFAPGESLVPPPPLEQPAVERPAPTIPAGDYSLPGGSEIIPGDGSPVYIVPDEGARVTVEEMAPPDVLLDEEEDQEPPDHEDLGPGPEDEGPDRATMPADDGWESDEWESDEWAELDMEYKPFELESTSP